MRDPSLGRLLWLVLISNWKRSWRKSVLLGSTIAVVTFVGAGSHLVTQGGTTNLENSAIDSGSLDYLVFAAAPDGNPISLDPSTVAVLENLTNVDAVAMAASVPGQPESAAMSTATENISIVATTANYRPLSNRQIIVNSRTRSSGAVVSVGLTAARQMRLTPECVVAGQCQIGIGGHTYRVGEVFDAGDSGFDNAVVIDIEAAVADGLISGPDTLIVTSRGLPPDRVEMALNSIASISNQTVFVESPLSAAQLRSSVGETWTTTIRLSAVGLMLLAAAAQWGLHALNIRSRRQEIVTLKSLGVPARIILLQLTLEAIPGALGGALAGVVAVAATNQVLISTFGFSGINTVGTSIILALCALAVAIGVSLFAAARSSQVSPADVTV